ncbi:hypothetical protein [Methylobacterium nodulans]|uniref:Uncharacterized protein n=1 Tax=Methylobacterium nodulans (strain LMG 21967 / CNCM I-2342 / ORS 2060) TaxID=460265 RepID=B8IS06_METNO|nr:hypothetical protein [Methylobacterium nodulans]ACL56818.1 conserved hypothetical protein [Methylobacterium nodulans ORS 2060]
MRRGVIALAAAGLPLAALGQGPSGQRFLVREGALLCVSPYSLPVAARAAQDSRWLAENGCLRATGGVTVRRLPKTTTTASGLIWNVQLADPDQAGLVLWGYARDFRLESGEPLAQDY